jgi:hypothetical protein
LLRNTKQTMRKAKDIKSKVPKQKSVTANMVAEVVGCTPTFVRDVWAGDHGKRATEKQENIEVATIMLQDGQSKLIAEVKRILG